MRGLKVSAATGPPGAPTISKYERIVIPKKVGIACTRRRIIHLVIKTIRPQFWINRPEKVNQLYRFYLQRRILVRRCKQPDFSSKAPRSLRSTAVGSHRVRSRSCCQTKHTSVSPCRGRRTADHRLIFVEPD